MSARLFAHIAARLLGRPLLLHPGKAEVIFSIVGERMGYEFETDTAAPLLMRERSASPAANRNVGEPIGPNTRSILYRRQEGVGIIPIVGTLVNRGLAIGEDSSGVTSYESIGTQVSAAVSDPAVGAIILDIDSPGGEAAGMFTLSAAIREARARKPIVAVINDMAASAGYGLASAATEIAISPTSMIGHIGVVLLHIDQSKELEMKGRKPTLIYAGAHKVDGHQFGPLSDAVRGDLQREVDTLYERFVESVSAGRPALTADRIRATEARPFIGREGIAQGLADRVASFAETFAMLRSQVNGGFLTGRRTMFTEQATIEGGPLVRAYGEAELNAAVTVAKASGYAEGEAAGRKVGAAEANERAKAILGAPEAAGRTALAMVFAFDTEMSSAAAIKALAAAAPLAAPAAATETRPPLQQRGVPPLPGNGPPTTRTDPTAAWDDVVKEINAQTARERAGLRR